MAKPTLYPEWAISDIVDPTSGQNNVVEPSAGHKNTGWTFKEFPPRQYFNWLSRLVNLWVQWFDSQVGQELNSTSNVTFNTVNTGHGANELYGMNQGVKDTDNVKHVNIEATGTLIAAGITTLNNFVSIGGQFKIKQYTIEDTMPATQGTAKDISIALIPISGPAIVSITAVVKSGFDYFQPGTIQDGEGAGHEYYVYRHSSNIRIYTSAANSSAIVTLPVKIVITYLDADW